MNKHGFTLMELLIVVLIIGVLSSLALPQYMRSIERSRATEAMSSIKALNDAVYAYAAGRSGNNACPTSFRRLVVSFPAETLNENGDTITTSNFIYRINSATNAPIAGTDCPGVTAQRNAGDTFDYVIWNPYLAGNTGRSRILACYSPSSNAASQGVCDSLDLVTDQTPGASF